MAFYYAHAKKMFDAYWEEKSAEMENAGMSSDDIQKMYDFDWACFKRARILSNREELIAPEDLDKSSDPNASQEWDAKGRFEFIQEIDDERLLNCMKKLSPDERKFLSLRYENRLNFSQIAAILEISEETVKKRHQRLIQFLRKIIKEK